MNLQFVPECLNKDITKITELIFQSQNINNEEIRTFTLNGGINILTDLISSGEKYMKINKKCDIIIHKIKAKRFGLFNIQKQIYIIRYWDDIENYSYMIMRIFNDDKKTLQKYIKILIIISPNNSCIILKKNKKLEDNKGSINNIINQVIENLIDSVKNYIVHTSTKEIDNSPSFIILDGDSENLYKKSFINLNKNQLIKFNEIKEKLDNRYGYDYFTNEEIIRVVYANEDVDYTYFQDYYKLRNKLYSKYIIQKQLKTNNFFKDFISYIGKDSLSRSVIYIRAIYFYSDSNIDEMLEYIICQIDRAIEDLTSDIDKILLILDLNNVTQNLIEFWRDSLYKIIDLLEKLYTGRLSNIYIINKPKDILFTDVLNIIPKPFAKFYVKINITNINEYSKIISKDYLT